MVQSAYLNLTPSVVALELDIAPGSQMAGALLRPLDTNADQRITSEWLEAKLVNRSPKRLDENPHRVRFAAVA